MTLTVKMVSTRTCCFVGLIFVITLIQFSQAFQCYSCTYIFAGHDGTAGYGCVNDTQDYTVNRQKLECKLPKQCVIHAVFAESFGTMQSMDRGCREPAAPDGCVDVSTRPACDFSCSSELCNDINGDLRYKYNVFDNGASSPTSSLGLTGLIFSTIVTLILKE